MLRKEHFMVIQALAQWGLCRRDIAKQVGMHSRTVRQALARGERQSGDQPPGQSAGSYRADIDRLLAEDVWNAVVIFRALQAKGVHGPTLDSTGLHPAKRAVHVRRATVRFETAPGRQLQRD